jgi:replicative superfamily II helicase
MVDFKKRLANNVIEKPLDPFEVYEKLDRASDKGPLRPAQNAVLEEWHEQRRTKRDVILKLHTGQGKTLVGLLILQSKLNETDKPAIYLCPNNFLVNQTYAQARQFGVNCVTAPKDLPPDFLDGKAILVTSVQKLFNGLTRFGIGPKSLPVGTLVMDDAHACIDAIRQACVIQLGRDHPAYTQIVNLFEPDLEAQGLGTFADIKRGDHRAFLPVPYWGWWDKQGEVAHLLSKHSAFDSIKFVWPLLKNVLADCLCIVSGEGLEIAPYRSPLDVFGSYEKAEHRVFMSATITDDSFLIRGLGLPEEVVRNPLIYKAEKWAGEKMILIPSLIDTSLRESEIVNEFAKPTKGRKFGIVVLCPSFQACEKWKSSGAAVATKTDIEAWVERLKAGKDGDRDVTLAVANRYDGIDLPDDSCRILILDSKPFAAGLMDRYVEDCREGSEVIATKTARTIEQGLGRSVRGEKDYCVIILIGSGLIKWLRTKEARKFFSAQTRAQIEIGLDIAQLAKDEIVEGTPPAKAFRNLILQSLRRDDGWKEFYVLQMTRINPAGGEPKALDVFAAESAAEKKYAAGAYDDAVEIIQGLIDNHISVPSDKGWYLQEMARYVYPKSQQKSNEYQVSGHRVNHYLLRPRMGMVLSKVATVSQKRVQNVIEWMKSFASRDEMYITLDDLLANLRFGVEADRFEKAFNELALALGCAGERPDKEWKEGPDNLWALRDNEYLLVECKSEVELTRESINKTETGQMNNSCAWFAQNYEGAKVKSIMIIPTKKVGRGAAFNDEVEIMRPSKLALLGRKVRSFFSEFQTLDLHDLSEGRVQELIDAHKLSVSDITSLYSEKPVTK